MKKTFLFILSLAAICLMASCDKNKSKARIRELTVTAANIAGLPAEANTVKAHIDLLRTGDMRSTLGDVIAIAPIENDGFVVNLDKTLPESNLTPYNYFPGISVEGATNAKTADVRFACYKDNEFLGIATWSEGSLWEGIGSVNESAVWYVYADKYFSLAGSVRHARFNVSFKYGWNIVSGEGNGDDLEYTNTPKAELGWKFFACEQ